MMKEIKVTVRSQSLAALNPPLHWDVIEVIFINRQINQSWSADFHEWGIAQHAIREFLKPQIPHDFCAAQPSPDEDPRDRE
jgi:hypothetical protein